MRETFSSMDDWLNMKQNLKRKEVRRKGFTTSKETCIASVLVKNWSINIVYAFEQHWRSWNIDSKNIGKPFDVEEAKNLLYHGTRRNCNKSTHDTKVVSNWKKYHNKSSLRILFQMVWAFTVNSIERWLSATLLTVNWYADCFEKKTFH